MHISFYHSGVYSLLVPVLCWYYMFGLISYETSGTLGYLVRSIVPSLIAWNDPKSQTSNCANLVSYIAILAD